MMMRDLERAQLAAFAARQAGECATVEQMKAIALCMRNRVRQGWHEASWLLVIEGAEELLPHKLPRVQLDPGNRNLQVFLRDIDEIYLSRRNESAQSQGDGGMLPLESAIETACYWMFTNRPVLAEFQKRILGDQENHPLKASMGLMMFLD